MRLKYYFLLHLIVIIFGFTGILGKEISISSQALVFYRMLIAFAVLGIYAAFRKKGKFSFSNLKAPALVGIVVAVHWITFFEAIKQSNVSVTLATMASTSFFVAVLDPIINRYKMKLAELVLGIVALAGLVLIFGFETQYKVGIILAICSSILAALFTILNANLVVKQDSLSISTIEMASGAIIVFIYLILMGKVDAEFFNLQGMDIIWLLLLGVVATAFAFLVSVEIMKELPPFTVALTVNLEPVYSIFLALLIYGDAEKMSSGFYLGATLIVGAIFMNTLFKKKRQ